MASKTFLEFMDKVANGDVDFDDATAKFRMKLAMSNTVIGTKSPEPTTMSGFSAAELDECDGANYAEKELASVSKTKDTTAGIIKIDATDPTWTSLGAGTRATKGYLIIWDSTGTNAAATNYPAFWVEFSANQTHNGNDFPIVFDSNGFAKIARS